VKHLFRKRSLTERVCWFPPCAPLGCREKQGITLLAYYCISKVCRGRLFLCFICEINVVLFSKIVMCQVNKSGITKNGNFKGNALPPKAKSVHGFVRNDKSSEGKKGLCVIIRIMLFLLFIYLYYYLFFIYDNYVIKKSKVI
jgi:hypothetical protein